jgi:hypothetical protein
VRRRTTNTLVSFGMAFSAALATGRVGAQEQTPKQAKPWFLIIMDTSGSMDDPPSLTNTCGFTSNKMGAAKCALQHIIDGTGDAEFGLMQFSHPCRDACDDQQYSSGNNCPNATECSSQILAAIASKDQSTVRDWVDGACQGSCSGGFTRELYSRGCTPLGASLRLAKDYLQGNAIGFGCRSFGPTRI